MLFLPHLCDLLCVSLSLLKSVSLFLWLRLPALPFLYICISLFPPCVRVPVSLFPSPQPARPQTPAPLADPIPKPVGGQSFPFGET